METELKLSELETFAHAMANKESQWKDEFKTWFGTASADYAKALARFINSSNPNPADIGSMDQQVSYETAVMLMHKMQQEVLADPVVADDDQTDEGIWRSSLQNYIAQQNGWRAFLKKGTMYVLRHPCRAYRKLRRLHRANVYMTFRSLVHIARARFIKEGGTAEGFKAFVLA